MEIGRTSSETAGKVIRCKAAICRNPGDPLVIEEIQVDPPKAWEVRIKIICTSLCHTDVTFWKLNTGPIAVFPRIFGHEAVGVVESVGKHVEEVEEGDKVVPVFLPNCKECRDCQSTKSNACSVFNKKLAIDMPRDGTSRFRDMNGEVLHHFLYVSSFSEFTVVDVAHVVRISPQVPVDKACLLSCGISTGIGAAWKVAEVEEGSTVAIFGLGSVGLAVAEGAKLRGASKIIGIDLNPEKFEIGEADQLRVFKTKEFGVTDFVNPATIGEKPVSEGWGKTVILGVEMLGTPLTLKSFDILRGRTVTGSLFGGLKPKTDIPLLVTKYLNKARSKAWCLVEFQELNLDSFISHKVSFKEINKAFDLLLQGKSLRCIIWMDE
ncbi:hypothetical protein FEM48_Zijuj06G0109800 [Ziziphus jujuba var. spinosa]|uniref:alcohol dehydrogenase n=1 Tax=Ziziphus jujuba var. spinosa TaxID=714518 RepID=A0A978V8W2_ZIZJJ|nr:hypothetical protein FEM48_Zijuj06G0109800 [Ziziphus jujuba var. spinosa]